MNDIDTSRPYIAPTSAEAGRFIAGVLSQLRPDRVAVLTDSNVRRLVLPGLLPAAGLDNAPVIETAPGDSNKTPATLAEVWRSMGDTGLTRHSALVNIGGGMVSDLGGFAAATFKRGILFINIATTLLAAVDAAAGGKTGVNLGHLKNEAGLFAPAAAVAAPADTFATLPAAELLSGYGEMVKSAYIGDAPLLGELAAFDPLRAGTDTALTARLAARALRVKELIVAADPHEAGLRKALNFGHTFGHALESMMLDRGTPVPHGIAVAYGMAAALVLSTLHAGLDSAVLHGYMTDFMPRFPRVTFSCDDYPELLALMRRDKKNHGDSIRFTLLSRPGEPLTGCPAAESDITAALDITRDMLHM